ncbi:hypothetical protein E1193_08320 [Micromonospora sp. KC606]|uniref:sensor histidine kinase n=1 Tax=Micromonospora sp. KC606 TaxID=2530379 RepID=UPI001051D9D7|nr:histidine kinase [Micromonospora sp. KC606]TDC83562.1 hypothetical protein E1193_08320 [Micromonospora sp. KC606]
MGREDRSPPGPRRRGAAPRRRLGAYLRSLDNARKRRLAAALAEQRAEFARDLHDFIAHHVTGIVVQAQGARLIAGQDPQRVIDALTQIECAGSETMTAMRRMVGVLRDDRTMQAPVVPLAGIAELAGLAHRFTASGGPPVRLHIDGILDGLPVDVDTSAFRIVLEALTDTRRHASGASAVDVSLRRTPDWLLVVVTDDGTPPTRAGRAGEHDGFGLAGIAERVKALGGRFHAEPGITGGWTVEATLPLKAKGNA